MNKKASMQDIIMISIIGLILTITLVFGSLVWEKIYDGMNGTLTPANWQTMENMRTGVTGAFDFIVPVATIFLGIGMIVLAKFTQAHPVWYVFAILLIVFGLFIGAILQDVTQTVMGTDPDVYSVYQQFPLTNWVVDNMLYVILGIGLLAIIVMYVTSGGETQGGII